MLVKKHLMPFQVILIIISLLLLSCNYNRNSYNGSKIDSQIVTTHVDLRSDSVTTNLKHDSGVQLATHSSAAGLPDQLVDAWVTFGTPAWGDGKNGDDSYLDIKIKFKTTDGKEYIGVQNVRDKSEIEPNVAIPVHLQFRGPIENLHVDNIAEIEYDIKYMKPNWNPNFPVNQDKWNARAEVVMKFKSGKILATGGNDPARTVQFRDRWESWPLPSIPRAHFFDHPTIVPPIG